MADFNAILEQLEPWSLFELNRLRSAIGRILDDPARNDAIKQHLKVGMKITYFCSDNNGLIAASIKEVRKTWASVINAHDGKHWNIKFSLINIEGVDTTIVPKKHSSGLDRNSLKVGDHVWYSAKSGKDVYGIVEKLNPKKALVRLGNGECWAVPYAFLFLVMDGFSIQGSQLCIEGEVVR